jgi:acetyltransferase-like isoleucine patch superfamily enzyme
MNLKLFSYYKKLTLLDFLRKAFHAVIQRTQWNIVRKVTAFYYFKTSAVKLGKNVRVYGLPNKIKIGPQTIFYDNCIFEFGHESEIHIGSNVLFSYGVVFACRQKITIGNDVQVGEHSSIRDTTHRYDEMNQPMKYAKDISDPITIGNDVWIGRGCLILPGTIIEEGVVVAANSVVKGNLEKNGIYGGSPAKFIKYRTD